MSETIKKLQYLTFGFTNIFAPMDNLSDIKQLGELSRKINNARLANREKNEQKSNKVSKKK